MKTGIKLLTAVAMMLVASSSIAQVNCDSIARKDSALIKKNLGMFNQYYKAKDYKAAYPYWSYLFVNAPCESKRITVSGPYVVKIHLKSLKKDDRAAYDSLSGGIVDTVLLTYDMRIKHWGDKWAVLLKKAGDMYKLKPGLRDSAMKLFAQCVDTLGNKSDYLSVKYYMQSAVKEHKKDKYSLDSLFELYFTLQQIIDHNIENNSRKKAKWIGSDTIVNKMMRPFFTCDKIEEFFKPKTDAKPNDVELLNKVADLMDMAKCNNTDYALDITIKSYSLDPTGKAAISIAKSYYGKKDNVNAVSWYLKGVEGLADSSAQADVYLRLAHMSYSEQKYGEAKKYANKVLAINPNRGNAHLIIASVYTKSVGSCEDQIDGRSVYWAIVDRAIKAKTVDPSVTDKANELINLYSAQFVTSTDAFFKGFAIAEGGTYTVPCLGVSTTVRFKK